MSLSALDENVPFLSTVPEPGQLVEVRRRHWIVGDVQGAQLQDDLGSGRQHLVTLTSIDEDSSGEEITVLWEIEPGAQVIERAGLPALDSYDDPEVVDAFLDAVTWGAATNADRSYLQAPFRSGVSIEDYQLDPLVRAIDMARVSLLIADDVGLGKTIEAGLVIQEMILRHRARTVMIICPSSLQIKWQMEMQEKFGLEFRIVDTKYLQDLRRERGIHANPWTSFPRLITSMDWIKDGEALRFMRSALPTRPTYPRTFDILVVDEAHNVAPSGSGSYALESQRTRLIRTLAPHFEHRMFLTATPHNGYEESFTSLLELLDDQRFARTLMPDEKQLQRVMVRRLKTDLVDENGKRIYPIRDLQALEVDYTKEELEMHQLLQEYTQSRHQNSAGKGPAGEFINILLKKRLFSSPAAFATTLAKHRESMARGRRSSRPDPFEDRILRKALLQSQEDYADDQRYEEVLDEVTEELAATAAPLSATEKGLLDRLSAWSERARNRQDSKAEAILRWLEEHLRPGGVWNQERVILFTEYRTTHGWLQTLLANHGFGGDRLMCLHGSMDRDEREVVKAAFQTSPDISPVRILLATDAASEGIDLQNHCRYLIHIEIPWNPNVMEQRNGRIDRHGQRASEVLILHPVGKGYRDLPDDAQIKVGHIQGDGEYLMRAVKKIDRIREDLGSVGPVIARQIEAAMLGKRGDLDTREAEQKAEKNRKFLRVERDLKQRIGRLHQRLLEARDENHLSPDRVARAVRVSLNIAHRISLEPANLPGVPEGKLFRVPILPGSWEKATAGLAHPHTKARRPITFDHEVAKGRDDVVLAHLNHRLVQMCLRLLRAEVWALEDRKQLHRVSIRLLPDVEIQDPVAIVCSRLVVTGGNHHRLHEELTYAGGFLREGSFARIPQVTRLENWMKDAQSFEPSEVIFPLLTSRFERYQSNIEDAIRARSKERIEFLTNTLERRKKAEIEDVSSVLDEMERALRKETSSYQLQPLFTAEELGQVEKDVDYLRARLERIPEERKLEIQAIEDRYQGLLPREFPVAVFFFVPKSLTGRV